MPFFEDIGAEDEALEHPIEGTFALLKDNLERMIAMNLAWTVQVIPAMLAFGFAGWPLPLRLVLFLYTALVLAPATGLLYKAMARICRNDPLNLDVLGQDLRQLLLPSLLSLAPTYSFLGLTLVLTFLTGTTHLLVLEVLIRLLMLLLLVCSFYWGPLFAEYPHRSPFFLLWQSILLVWRYPVPLLIPGALAVILLLLGTISIGGLFLIVPALVALLQTRKFYELLAREQRRRKRTART